MLCVGVGEHVAGYAASRPGVVTLRQKEICHGPTLAGQGRCDYRRHEWDRAATAELFVAEGAKVVLTGRSRDKGAALAQRLGPAAIYHEADVMREADIKASIDLAVERFGSLDILFNNAGGPTRGAFETISGDDIDYGVHLLLRSVMLGIRYAIEPMKAAGGGLDYQQLEHCGDSVSPGRPLVLGAQGRVDPLLQAGRR